MTRKRLPCRTACQGGKVDVRLPGKGHGARPVHRIITMIKWIRTSRLSIKNSLSDAEEVALAHGLPGWALKDTILTHPLSHFLSLSVCLSVCLCLSLSLSLSFSASLSHGLVRVAGYEPRKRGARVVNRTCRVETVNGSKSFSSVTWSDCGHVTHTWPDWSRDPHLARLIT